MNLGKIDLDSLLMGLQIGPVTLVISMENSQKAKEKSIINPSYSTHWYIPERLAMLFYRQLLSHVLYHSICNN